MIPQFSSAAGTTGRIVVARVAPDMDLLESLEAICVRHGIRYGVITGTIGSLRRVNLHFVNRVVPIEGKGYTDPLVMDGPFNVLCGQGLVSPADDPDRRNIHYHAVLSGENDVVYGGHIEKGTVTLTTLDVSILEIHDIALARKRDPQTGVIVTFVENG